MTVRRALGIVLALALAALAPAGAALAQRCADHVPGARPQNTPRAFVGQGLDEIRARGFIEFAVYEDFAPYSWRDGDEARGVDVELGRIIAEYVGVEPRFRFVPASETVEADLMNYVWRGAIVDGRVSNVMLHVPYDSQLVCRIEQVVLTGQYFNERVAIAYRTDVYPDKAPTPAVFRFETVGVENDSIADFYLSSFAGGAIVPKMRRFRTPEAAMAALAAGEVTAVMGLRGQLEHGAVEGVAIDDGPFPNFGRGEWTLGLAVHQSHRDLAYEVDDAVQEALRDGRLAAIFEASGLSFHPPAW